MIPPILYAQFLSLLVSSSGIFVETLQSSCDTNIPTFQTFLVYCVLALFTVSLHRRQYRDPSAVEDKLYRLGGERGLRLGSPWYIYLLLGLLDVQSNFLVVSAFRLTSLTSISLLDCTSIPWVMFFSSRILGRSYNRWQYLSALVCVAGIGLIILSDSSSSSSGPSPIAGDAICLAGAFLYALNNVLCEKYVQYDRFEYLGMMGLFAACVSVVQMLALERAEVWRLFTEPDPACEPGESGGLVAGYVASISGFYVLVSGFLVDSSAALLNVSLLTADIYSLLFVVFAEGVVPNWLYFLGTAAVFLGVGLFNYHERAQERGGGGGVGVKQVDGDGGGEGGDAERDKAALLKRESRTIV